MKNNEDRIKDVQDLGRHFRGRRELLAHYEGKPLTRKQAMDAVCFDCSGFYDDGPLDCENPWCPLYPFMPYRSDKGPKKERSEKQRRASASLGQRSREKGAVDTLKHTPTEQDSYQGGDANEESR